MLVLLILNKTNFGIEKDLILFILLIIKLLTIMEKKNVIESLIKAGAKSVKNLKVKNVNVVPQESYVRISLSVDKAIRGFVAQEDGTYKEGESKVIFVSLFSIIAQLRDDENASFAVNHILSHPESVVILLSGATLDILQEDVASGQEYHNPWSDNTDNVTTFEHDTIINHIVNVKMNERAYKMLDKLADSMLGI